MLEYDDIDRIKALFKVMSIYAIADTIEDRVLARRMQDFPMGGTAFVIVVHIITWAHLCSEILKRIKLMIGLPAGLSLHPVSSARRLS